ncbi:MAG: KpsF/GutQ family sugar-phosphate isomerase [Bacteroidaceae bacterium]|jgi:arabinose-5-phosphate isomerase|nr:KpsF/GutQ family sugar-phosphate isomerase [Bacteroidaceae bacterium]MBR4648671.1 KpsF/GutQ family sugar-phosphate isomerase [Bacteroidaceae bacterium]MBR6713713.1 KpsF/GutQ family sugar-phosphate isomerase [Bacteroidaceae bacterium]MDO4952074.1 KpsF/GutQ family sugar-phosphate isomerase [Bacteroidales bacterium]
MWNSTAIQCFKDEAQALLDLIPKLNEDFDKAINLILSCKGKVIITGVGKSGHIGAKIAATLSSTGTPSFYVNPLDLYHGDLGVIMEGDVVIAISNSGYTDELLRLVPSLNERSIPIIGMSGNPDSLLAQNSYAHLNIAVEREADPLNLAPTSSTTATLAMGDAIACCLVKARGFREMDFAQFHPGGMLGKRLLTKASDVMHTQDLPVVTPATPLPEAVTIVSQGRLGICIAVDDDRICGIITDGDIRRAMQHSQSNFFTLKVGDVMTHNPKTVPPTMKIVEIDNILNRNKIHCVLVADADRHLLGVVDSFSTVI